MGIFTGQDQARHNRCGKAGGATDSGSYDTEDGNGHRADRHLDNAPRAERHKRDHCMARGVKKRRRNMYDLDKPDGNTIHFHQSGGKRQFLRCERGKDSAQNIASQNKQERRHGQTYDD